VVPTATTSGTTTQEESYDVADSGARWVRYLGHGNTVNTFNSVTEISVFALAATPTPTPVVTATPTPVGTPIPPPQSYYEVTPGAARVTASTNDGNVPANVVDNNLATRWSANGDGQWVQLDLNGYLTVGYIKVAVYNGNMRANKFELQVLQPNGSWTTVFSGQSSGTTTAEETYDFADVSGTAVRYLGHMNTVNTFNSVTEISVFALTPIP
jgi:endoglucanase